MELIELMQKCCLCWAFGHLREDYLAKVYIDFSLFTPSRQYESNTCTGISIYWHRQEAPLSHPNSPRPHQVAYC